MPWQDIVMTVANITFCLSLVPQVILGFREKKGHISYATSGPTTVGLYAISLSLFSLHLYYSSFVTFVCGTLWLVLLIQRARYGKP